MFFSQVMRTFKKEDLLPLPEGACLSSSSPPPSPLTLPPMSFDLPPPFQMMPKLSTRSDSTWATTAGPSLLGVVLTTILRIPEYQLYHPQPQSTQETFGTILPFHTVPTFPTMKLLPTSPMTMQTPTTGTNQFRTQSSHLSLYQLLPSNSLLNLPETSHLPGERLMSDISLQVSTDSVRHKDMRGPVRQLAQTLPQSYSPKQSTSTEFMEKVLSHPPSCQSIHSTQPTQTPPLMTLTNAIQIYEMTRFEDLTVQIPEVLVQADYNNLFSYFAYELPFILAWVKTKAGNDYFMNQQRNLPSDEIL